MGHITKQVVLTYIDEGLRYYDRKRRTYKEAVSFISTIREMVEQLEECSCDD